MDALDLLATCGAMRYLRPDPVPDELLRRVVEAATWAPSPGNSQGWEFIVVRDEPERGRLAGLMGAAVRPVMPQAQAVEAIADPERRRMLTAALHLLDNISDVPVWILVCGRAVYPAAAPSDQWIGAALYPAAQNLVVAARSLGLATAFTTYHMLCEAEVRALLGLPEDLRVGVTIPLGWPARPFRRVRRRPVDDVLHWQRWTGRGEQG